MDTKWRSDGQRVVAEEALVLFAALTPRERDVLEGVLEGKTNKQIASILAISIRTVENHRAHMMRCLHARHVADAIRIALMARCCVSGQVGEAQVAEKSKSAA